MKFNGTPLRNVSRLEAGGCCGFLGDSVGGDAAVM